MKEIMDGVSSAATVLASGKPEAIIWLLIALLVGFGFAAWRASKLFLSHLDKKETAYKEDLQKRDANLEKYGDKLFALAQTMQTSNAEIAHNLEQLALELRIRGGQGK